VTEECGRVRMQFELAVFERNEDSDADDRRECNHHALVSAH
jgi:hypothetical protein